MDVQPEFKELKQRNEESGNISFGNWTEEVGYLKKVNKK